MAPFDILSCRGHSGPAAIFGTMYQHGNTMRGNLNRPNTVKFNLRDIKGVLPQEVHQAIYKEIGHAVRMKCIAPLENGWWNVTFDNETHCEQIATEGFSVKNLLVQCERASIRNSAVVYIKAPYEMTDQVIINVLMEYGTVANIRRQIHDFDETIETGVRSCLIKNIKKPIPSYIKAGAFTLPIRYKGQQKTCKICQQPNHLARDCPKRGRCFVCGSQFHRASWHDMENYEDRDNDSITIHEIAEVQTDSPDDEVETLSDVNEGATPAPQTTAEDIPGEEDQEPEHKTTEDQVEMNRGTEEQPTSKKGYSEALKTRKSTTDDVQDTTGKSRMTYLKQQPTKGEKQRPSGFYDDHIKTQSRKRKTEENGPESKQSKEDNKQKEYMEIETPAETVTQSRPKENEEPNPQGVQRLRYRRGTGGGGGKRNDSAGQNAQDTKQKQGDRGRGRGRTT